MRSTIVTCLTHLPEYILRFSKLTLFRHSQLSGVRLMLRCVLHFSLLCSIGNSSAPNAASEWIRLFSQVYFRWADRIIVAWAQGRSGEEEINRKYLNRSVRELVSNHSPVSIQESKIGDHRHRSISDCLYMFVVYILNKKIHRWNDSSTTGCITSFRITEG